MADLFSLPSFFLGLPQSIKRFLQAGAAFDQQFRFLPSAGPDGLQVFFLGSRLVLGFLLGVEQRIDADRVLLGFAQIVLAVQDERDLSFLGGPVPDLLDDRSMSSLTLLRSARYES